MRRLLAIAWPALAVATVLALPWLTNPLFLDDWHNLVSARDASWSPADLAYGFSFLDHEGLASWNLPATDGYHFFRPLLVGSFKLDLLLWGTAAYGFHLTNLAFHLICVFLVTGLVMRLSGDRRLARLGAILWVVNPQTAVAVIWTSGRTELVVTVWILAALWCYIVAREDRRPLLMVPVLLFTALAFLSKESAVLLPMCLFAYEVTLARARDQAAWLRRAAIHLAPVAVITLAYLIFRFAIFDSGPTPGRPYFNSPGELAFLGFAAAKLTYYMFAVVTGAFIVPLFGVEFLRSYLLALLGLIAITALLYRHIIKKARRRARPRFHAFLWLVLAASLLPTLPTLATDLYLYFASIALAMVLACAFLPPRHDDSARPRRGWRRHALLAYIVFLALGHLGRGVFYRAHGVASERTYAEIVAETPGGVGEGSRLYLINMPLVSAHVAPMIRLRDDRDDVRAVLVTVSTAWVEHKDEAIIECVSPTLIRIRPPADRQTFFSTREEFYLQQLEQPFDPHRDYVTEGARVHPITDGDRVVGLDLILDGPADGDRFRVYSFHDDGARMVHRVCGPDSADS